MPELWAGIDAGKAHHHRVLIDDEGNRLLSRNVANDEAALTELLTDVQSLAAAREILWATDLNRGGAALLIGLLEAPNQTLIYIPGRTVYHAARTYRGDGKTDVSDAAWLADLGTQGLVRASFLPPPPIRELRDLTRARTIITSECTLEIQRLEKLLEDACIELSWVASDITGLSGRLMLQGLIEGQNDPAVLAELAHGRMRAKIPELAAALTGRFSDRHRYMAELYLHRIDAHTADIDALSARIEEATAPFRLALPSLPFLLFRE